MLGALAVIVPLGLAGSISPVMLTEQTLLLAGRGGRRSAVYYAIGVAVTLLVIVGSIVFFGQAISLPTEPHLDAALDLLLGAILLGVARLVFVLGQRRRGPRTRSDSRAGPRRAPAALLFGAFSMTTNVTTLVLMAPAAKEIASAAVGVAGRLLLVLLLVGLASGPAWAPIALTAMAPGPGGRALGVLRSLIARHGRTVMIALFAVAGVFFGGRGAIRLMIG